MRYEKVIERENGDTVKLVTMISANVFVECGYEIEQFALVRTDGFDEWKSYHHQWTPKSISRQAYMDKYKPHTLLGVVTIGEILLDRSLWITDNLSIEIANRA